MVLTIKIDVKSAILYFTFVCIALVALALAYPNFRIFLSQKSDHIASWVQAIGSLMAIAATWYIASSDKRERRESEYRLAALDASTMYAELCVVLTSLQIVRSDITRALIDVDLSRIPSVSARLQEIKIRPLSEQKELAVVGVSYFGEISAILRQLSILQNNIDIIHFSAGQDAAMRKFSLTQVVKDAERTEYLLANVAQTLRTFAAGQGVILDDLI